MGWCGGVVSAVAVEAGIDVDVDADTVGGANDEDEDEVEVRAAIRRNARSLSQSERRNGQRYLYGSQRCG